MEASNVPELRPGHLVLFSASEPAQWKIDTPWYSYGLSFYVHEHHELHNFMIFPVAEFGEVEVNGPSLGILKEHWQFSSSSPWQEGALKLWLDGCELVQ